MSDEMHDLLLRIKSIREQIKLAYRTKNAKHVMKLTKWLKELETEYDTQVNQHVSKTS